MDNKNPFEYQKATSEQTEKLQASMDVYKVLYEFLQSLPESRQRNVAITKLEESAMWANKSIVFN